MYITEATTEIFSTLQNPMGANKLISSHMYARLADIQYTNYTLYFESQH